MFGEVIRVYANLAQLVSRYSFFLKITQRQAPLTKRFCRLMRVVKVRQRRHPQVSLQGGLNLGTVQRQLWSDIRNADRADLRAEHNPVALFFCSSVCQKPRAEGRQCVPVKPRRRRSARAMRADHAAIPPQGRSTVPRLLSPDGGHDPVPLPEDRLPEAGM